MIEDNFIALNSGITLCYKLYKDEKSIKSPVVLVQGLGGQLSSWPDSLIAQLQREGYPVLVYDHRDSGLSSKSDYIPPSCAVNMFNKNMGLRVQANYVLEDLAEDLNELCEKLDLHYFHLIGISMGGLVAQIYCAKYPNKVINSTFIMSTPNHKDMPSPSYDVLLESQLINPLMMNLGLMESADSEISIQLKISGIEDETDKSELIRRVEFDFNRSHSTKGLKNQLASVIAQGSVEEFSKKIKVPVTLIHGLKDQFIKPECSIRLKEIIKHAELILVQKMGHYLLNDHSCLVISSLSNKKAGN